MFNLAAQKAGYAGIVQEYNLSGEDALSAYHEMMRSGDYAYVIVKRYQQPVATWIHPAAHRMQIALGRADETCFTVADPRYGSWYVIKIIEPKEVEDEYEPAVYDLG